MSISMKHIMKRIFIWIILFIATVYYSMLPYMLYNDSIRYYYIWWWEEFTTVILLGYLKIIVIATIIYCLFRYLAEKIWILAMIIFCNLLTILIIGFHTLDFLNDIGISEQKNLLKGDIIYYLPYTYITIVFASFIDIWYIIRKIYLTHKNKFVHQ